ncbi:hypothetical protein GLOTRDRAFT_123756 [Gloeophyllum trabeum ATCC 11539]|uniref:Uncharacterized protein n=1 Tax=Gloeophyllum trabeum (strain ATCC 11539 / FP-39264 / Madison 617) TaxID=670483 RepID=S7QL46_GLOTA|nr:uncharacterized protein GLOTRDRAFT_123756 [Gloeophyllum trabeum ATCC 11539]EPQ59997.1 hypothetical protein GLOTRDRAFT_123756 [Gloeophyllum trabeum ATCC 11539]
MAPKTRQRSGAANQHLQEELNVHPPSRRRKKLDRDAGRSLHSAEMGDTDRIGLSEDAGDNNLQLKRKRPPATPQMSDSEAAPAKRRCTPAQARKGTNVCIDNETDKENALQDSERYGYSSESYLPENNMDMDPPSNSDAASENLPVKRRTRKGSNRSQKGTGRAAVGQGRNELHPISEEEEYRDGRPSESHSRKQGGKTSGSQTSVPVKARLKANWMSQKSEHAKHERTKPNAVAHAGAKSTSSNHAPATGHQPARRGSCEREASPSPPPPQVDLIMACGSSSRGWASAVFSRPQTSTIADSLNKRISKVASPVKEGGFPGDEDEGHEEEAAKSSPVKGQKRVTSSSMVSVHVSHPPLESISGANGHHSAARGTQDKRKEHRSGPNRDRDEQEYQPRRRRPNEQ